MPSTPTDNPPPARPPSGAALPISVTGVQLAKGVGLQPAKGFWTDAWSHVLKRPAAVVSLIWLGIVVFFAVYSPLLASGHPITYFGPDAANAGVARNWFPLVRFLSAVDVILLVFVTATVGAGLIPGKLAGGRAKRVRVALVLLVQAIATVAILGFFKQPIRSFAQSIVGAEGSVATYVAVAIVAIPLAAFCGWVLAGLMASATGKRANAPGYALALVAALAVIAVAGWKFNPPLRTFPYREAIQFDPKIEAVYTLVPFSPAESDTAWYHLPPGTTYGEASSVPDHPRADDRFRLGTDGLGQDVASQMLHACRLSISVGLVSTGIAVLIGVTIGSLMGYFGGWVDLLLYRVVEVFMAVPVLFLLIVAAGVLPPEFRTTYVMMAIIGCFTWTGAARFTRAEFLKLRRQDFVQSAQSVGLPLRSILFKHMLPNGVTPVLVESSFTIAAAILIEAILSFLGLGPIDQPSWGKLLATAISDTGGFKWWLAVFPGAAIFFTVLAYNLIGEALRDAIDPKLKKARV